MTFSLTREDYFSQNQILGFDYFTEIQEDLLGFKKGTTQFLEFDLDLLPVSYTHLTLPTIYSV